jgi:uncharacterized protein
MVSEDLINRAARALADAADGPAPVMFGSRARGESAADSDIDLLVVERDVHDRFAESVRLSRLAGELRVPADVIVVSERQVEDWG